MFRLAIVKCGEASNQSRDARFIGATTPRNRALSWGDQTAPTGWPRREKRVVNDNSSSSWTPRRDAIMGAIRTDVKHGWRTMVYHFGVRRFIAAFFNRTCRREKRRFPA